jgi:hypothetical protein
MPGHPSALGLLTRQARGDQIAAAGSVEVFVQRQRGHVVGGGGEGGAVARQAKLTRRIVGEQRGAVAVESGSTTVR